MGSPQLSPLPPQQPRALHWMQQSPHHSTKAPLCPPGSPLRAAMVVGAPSPTFPPFPLSAYLAPALQLQPLGRSSLPLLSSLSPSLLPCLCQVPPLSQAQSCPGDRRAMLKAFSQFYEDRGVRIVVGGLAPSRHCFNPGNTGGSFSLPPPARSSSQPSLLAW